MPDTNDDLKILTLAERPDLWGHVWSFGGTTTWPEFMIKDPLSGFYYGTVQDRFADWVVALLDQEERVLGCGFSVPYDWDGDEATLSDRGWDDVMLRVGRADGPVRAASAVEIRVRPELRGQGYSSRVLDGLRRNAADRGVIALLAPVRPNEKHREPHTPIREYAARRRPDGLPADAWLRVHVRAGGRIVKVASCSMTISGTIAEWRAWTGLPFNHSGPTEVPGALVPVHVDLDQDHAVYVEPNVWVIHNTSRT